MANVAKLAAAAWIEVERIREKIKRASPEDLGPGSVLIADRREALRVAHYWQEIVNDDRGVL